MSRSACLLLGVLSGFGLGCGGSQADFFDAAVQPERVGGGAGAPSGGSQSAVGGSAGSANGGSANGGSANGGSANGGSANGGSANGGMAGAPFGSAGAPANAPCSPARDVSGGSSGPFNSMSGVCLRVTEPITGWGCSNFDGRTIKVNGMPLTCSQVPLPAQVDGAYYFDISAGMFDYASMYWFQ